MGTQDVMKIEIVVRAGRPNERIKLASRATSRLLREGTKSFNSAQIAEQLDFFAGTLQTPVSLDTANIVLYSMTKHFSKLLPLLAEMLLEPTFPQRELDTFVENSVSRLAVELTKNDVVAYRKISAMIFGDETPYGYNSTETDYRALKTDDLKRHHAENYTADNTLIFISGKFDDTIFDLLNQYLGQHRTVAQQVKIEPLSISDAVPSKIRLETADKSQAAIRIGKRIGSRKNPDHDKLFVLNTILGGYFGSRLMSNIREEKGYTYGINSSIDLNFHDGFFYIGTEVGTEYLDKTLVEIYREMDKLQTELIEDDELEMVKNYLLGNLLNLLDGPFAVSGVIVPMVLEDLPFSAFDDLIKTIRFISAEELRDLARKYFRREMFFEVVVS